MGEGDGPERAVVVYCRSITSLRDGRPASEESEYLVHHFVNGWGKDIGANVTNGVAICESESDAGLRGEEGARSEVAPQGGGGCISLLTCSSGPIDPPTAGISCWLGARTTAGRNPVKRGEMTSRSSSGKLVEMWELEMTKTRAEGRSWDMMSRDDHEDFGRSEWPKKTHGTPTSYFLPGRVHLLRRKRERA